MSDAQSFFALHELSGYSGNLTLKYSAASIITPSVEKQLLAKHQFLIFLGTLLSASLTHS